MDNKDLKKNTLLILSAIAVLIISVSCLLKAFLPGAYTGSLKVSPGDSSLCFPDQELEIKGRDTGDCTFFFLPSYMDIKRLDQSSSPFRICTADGSELETPHLNEVQDIFVYDPSNGSMTPWRIGIFKSENLYTLDITLDGIEYPDIDHYTYSKASVSVYSPSGKRTYSTDKASIKGRGNSSWVSDSPGHKNPYQIKLPSDIPLCNMKPSDKWALIVDDPTGMRNKLSYDLASDMGMEYSISADWTDLYINGQYMGNYLLCHEPDIGSGDLDIGSLTALNRRFSDGASTTVSGDLKGFDHSMGSLTIPSGGYLIEKNSSERYEKKSCGFLSGDDFFTLKSPDNAPLDEVSYIKDFVDEADAAVHGNKDRVSAIIDPYSFARQYLITELSLDPDAAFTSYYFYKKPDEDKLFAGPCWDFDGAYGRWTDPVFKDYNSSIFDIQKHINNGSGYNALDWDETLLKDEEYREYVGEVFREYLPVYAKLLTERLDSYQAKIYPSLRMDHIRWSGSADSVDEIKSACKFLTFFLHKRLLYLSGLYGGSSYIPEPDICDGTIHTLTFFYPDGSREEMEVEDGAQLDAEDLPEYDHSLYEGWRINDQYMSLLSYFDPIFEDRTLVLGEYEIPE